MNILDIAIAKKLAGGGGGSGTDNYNDLSNLPKINDTTLSGNKSSSALGLQSEINSDSKLASDLVDDTNQDNKFVTSTEKNTWNAKQNAIDSDHKLSSDLVDDANHTNKFVTSTEKQTWNAKQNAIDADHKLSSSLVSFTDAEAAALASGIDSSKVGQISTNQTNILYTIRNGAKNLYEPNINTEYYNKNGANITQTYSNGAITIKGTTATAAAYLAVCEKFTPNYTGEYVFSSVSGLIQGKFSMYVATGSSFVGEQVTADNPARTYSLTAGTTYTLGMIVSENYTIDTTIYPMLCEKTVWDNLNHDFQPPSLPNSDLTYLEAEDRASLIEVVDSGAKNELQPSWTTQTINGVTFTVGSDGVITATTTGTRTSAAIYPLLSRYSGTKMAGKVMSISPKGGTNASYYVAAEQADSPWHNVGTDYGDGVVISSEANNKNINVNIVIPANYSPNNLKFYPMICTKAAFGVSPKFVPYRIPIKGVYVQDILIACSTTLTTTGIKFTATEKAAYRITATAIYYNSIPLKLVIKYKTNSSANQLPFCTATHADGEDVSLIASGIISLDASGEFEVFAQYASQTSNYFYVLVEKIG